MNSIMKTISFASLFLTLLCISTAVFAISPSNLLWNGFAQVSLDKTEFDSNEDITGSIYLNNTEYFPLVDGRIVLQIVEGDYVYPSQNGSDNIVSEIVINNVWVLPTSMKKIDFILPKQSKGNYRLDLYVWVVKSQFIGSSAIMYNPLSTLFTVKGIEEKKVIIDRAKTVFGPDNTAGPVGFPVNAGEEISGTIVLKNSSNSSKNNLLLEVYICEWAFPFCDTNTPIEFTAPQLKSLEEKEIQVLLKAPLIPSAYEINLVLKNSSGSIESIYKNRVIVSGPTAKARKVFISGIDTKNYSITAVVAGSPDHFANPVFENFKLSAEVYLDGSKIETKFTDINSLKTAEIIIQKFDFSSTSFDRVCIVASKENTEYERECFDVPLKDITLAYIEQQAVPVKVSWNYNETDSSLSVLLEKDLINARIILLDNATVIHESEVINKLENFTQNITIEQKNLTLVVDDLDVKKQQVFELKFDSSTDLSNITLPKTVDINGNIIESNCTKSVCSNGSVCSVQTYSTVEGACCPAICIQENVTQNDTQVPLVLITAVLLVIVAIIIAFTTLKRLRK